MGFFIVIIVLIILVGMINLLKKESSNHDSSKSHSNHSCIDYSSTNTFISVEDSNTHNCSGSASSYSDTSSCGDSGSSD
jgi:hypothetical protein